jgi:hypothetical protein
VDIRRRRDFPRDSIFINNPNFHTLHTLHFNQQLEPKHHLSNNTSKTFNMAGIVNKVKDMMHKDKDATHSKHSVPSA